MNYTKADYNGFEMLVFEFLGRKAMLVLPKVPAKNKPWLLKTEYFWAFPSFECEMLRNGYHVAYIESVTRWHDNSDDDMKHEFSQFLQNEFGLYKKCLPVGLSCGGMQAIYYGAKYPDDVVGLYLDAPVVNLLSCPFGLGVAKSDLKEDFIAHTGLTVSDMLAYRNHPLDNLEPLVAYDIPIFLVSGDSDNTVPYIENGRLVYEFYKKHNADINLILKPGCDHHPHGLDNVEPLVTWAKSLFE